MNSHPTKSGPRDATGAATIVIPGSKREEIKDTQKPPYFYIGELEMTFPNDKVYTGTGTLIAPDLVLTCAHNLYDQQDGGDAKSVSFALARCGSKQPYGNVQASGWRVPELYRTLSPSRPDYDGNVKEYTHYLHDYGLVRLGQALGQKKDVYPKLHPAKDEEIEKETLLIAGYPGDKASGTMWAARGKATVEKTEAFIFYGISTYRGQSGSPLLTTTTLDLRIVGVHVAGLSEYEQNFAVRLNEEVVKELEAGLEG